MRAIVTRGREQSGQVLLLAVLGMLVVMGFVAMTIDVGLAYQDRRHYQNSADAAAMAGAAELPKNPTLAVDRARQWANKNGIPNADIQTIQVRSTKYANDTIYVELNDEFEWVFARVLGETTDSIVSQAGARVNGYGGGHNIMPWALLQGDSTCLYPDGTPIMNTGCTVKVGSITGAITGWYGALDLDGSGGGSSEYQANILDGESDTLYCSQGETAPGCESTVDTLTGNQVGGTGKGIDERLSNEPTARCDTDGGGKDDFGEVFAQSTGTGPAYSVVCPESPRLIFIPIVSYDQIPVKTVTIEGWALAYLEGYSCLITCSGLGQYEVQVKVVETNYSDFPGVEGVYSPMSTVTSRELIQ